MALTAIVFLLLARAALVAEASTRENTELRMPRGVSPGDLPEAIVVGDDEEHERINIPRAVFPLTLVPSRRRRPVSLAKRLSRTPALEETIECLLRKHGAILFRGFAVPDAQSFSEVISAFAFLEDHDGAMSAAPRRQLADRVYTANEAPPDTIIPFHHEMAQAEKPPSHLFFYCERAASTGGSTPIVRSDVALAELRKQRPDFVRALAGGVRYRRVVPEFDDPASPQGRGWRALFRCESKEECETVLKEQSYDWGWLDDSSEGGDLVTLTQTLPAMRVPSDVEEAHPSFFNSIVAATLGWNDARNVGSRAVLLPGGEPIDPEDVEAAGEALEKFKVAFKWQPGDVLLVDNRRTLHSRTPFTGNRRVLASLAHSRSNKPIFRP